MTAREHERSEGSRPGPGRGVLGGLAAAAFLAALAASVSPAFAQESQQAPAQEGAQQRQEAPQEGGAPELELTEERFQDWLVRCGKPDEQGPEVCEMQQEQVDREDRTVMAVAVGLVPGTSDVGLLILLPLGILLPPGVTMQIDGGPEIRLQVERCERQGCRIERILEPDLLNRLKAGTKATVYFQAIDPQGERQRVAIPISLLGFTAALNQVVG